MTTWTVHFTLAGSIAVEEDEDGGIVIPEAAAAAVMRMSVMELAEVLEGDPAALSITGVEAGEGRGPDVIR